MVAPLRLRVPLIRATLKTAPGRQHKIAKIPASRRHVPPAAPRMDVAVDVKQVIVLLGRRAKTAHAVVNRIAVAGRAGQMAAAASAASAPRGRLVTSQEAACRDANRDVAALAPEYVEMMGVGARAPIGVLATQVASEGRAWLVQLNQLNQLNQLTLPLVLARRHARLVHLPGRIRMDVG
jgi:hypothetical protein